MSKWAGAYEFPNGAIRHITVKDGQIFSQREGSTNLRIYPMTANQFIFEDGNITYNFSMIDNKRQAKFITDETFVGKEIEKAPPAEKVNIQLSNDILKQYIGKYEVQPQFILDVTVEENQIFTQATGQAKFEIFAESDVKFYLKVVTAQIVFNINDSGDVSSLTLYQNGQEIVAKKIE